MDGIVRPVTDGRSEALLPSPRIQNHAPFLSWSSGQLQCLWFGGTLEGKSDISIWRSTLTGSQWSDPELLSDDPERSEQNPVQFKTPSGETLLINTAQKGGSQDSCVLRARAIGQKARELPLPKGTFVRAPIVVRDDGAWLLPLFRCITQPDGRWTGNDDTAAVAITQDDGATWRMVEVPNSIGCVHMTLVDLGEGRIAAFYRRRQADFVHRAESVDGGENWSAPLPTNIPNNNSSISVIRLHDGRLAMACNPSNAAMHPYARRLSLYDELGEDDGSDTPGTGRAIWGVPRAPMALCFSETEGRAFETTVTVEDGPGTCLTNNSTDGNNHEMSYPSLAQQPDGTLDLAYTYHRRAIKHVRLSNEWLAQT